MDLEGYSAEETATKLNEAHPKAHAECGLHDDHLVFHGDCVGADAFADLRAAGWYVTGIRSGVMFLHRD